MTTEKATAPKKTRAKKVTAEAAAPEVTEAQPVKKETALDLTAQMRKLESLVESGELTQDDIADTLEGIEGMVTDKLDFLVELMALFASNEERLKAQEAKIAKRRKMWTNQQSAIKDRMKTIVESSGKNMLKSAMNTFTLASGRTTFRVPDPKALPDNFYDVIPTYTARMDDIKAAMEALSKGVKVEGIEGDTIPGVEVVVGATSLRIS